MNGISLQEHDFLNFLHFWNSLAGRPGEHTLSPPPMVVYDLCFLIGLVVNYWIGGSKVLRSETLASAIWSVGMSNIYFFLRIFCQVYMVAY